MKAFKGISRVLLQGGASKAVSAAISVALVAGVSVAGVRALRAPSIRPQADATVAETVFPTAPGSPTPSPKSTPSHAVAEPVTDGRTDTPDQQKTTLRVRQILRKFLLRTSDEARTAWTRASPTKS